jgi:Metallo-beta-lactamase superfamily
MSSVRVRMYRQGLGDCFLLSFPRGSGESHVLIDCGVLKGTEDASENITRAANSIYVATGGKLDALVVTHQHWDHVSGFLQAQEVFDRFQVNEVWLAWTEDPADNLARELAGHKNKALTAVRQAARQLTATAEPSARQSGRRLANLLGFYGELGAAGQKTTVMAVEWVKGRSASFVRYLKPENAPFEPAILENVRIYVLGPPRDSGMLRRSDPSKRGSEVYELAGITGVDQGFLAAVNAAGDNSPSGGQPFDKWFAITDAEAWDNEFFGEHYGFEADDGLAWRRIETDWLAVAGRLALQLDSHTNNTSLALAFELIPSGRVLLFPGDAQVENWLSWSQRTWRIKDVQAGPAVTVENLLARTVLYKVGHHGSHNATLRAQGLELMTNSELTAMLPVDRKTARKLDWLMPFPSLYRRLLEKTNGRLLDLEFGLSCEKPTSASDQEWREFLSRTEVRPDWIDYRAPL